MNNIQRIASQMIERHGVSRAVTIAENFRIQCARDGCKIAANEWTQVLNVFFADSEAK